MDLSFSITTTKPTLRQRNIAFAAAAVIFVTFVAVAPFGATQLQRIDSFVPVVEGIIFLTDLVTAVLLFGQFTTSRSRALLVLAGGYLFTALIVIPHIFSFPGAFTPTGIFGARPQAPPWLYTFWHFGFATAVVGYACLKEGGQPVDGTHPTTAATIPWTVLIVISLVCALTLVVTAGHEYMPSLVSDEIRFASLSRVVAAITLSLSVLALALLWVRRSSVLDLWLMVVVCALIAELAVNTFVIASRFSLGFYSSRGFSVVVSTIMLVVLLWETTKLYANLTSVVRTLRRERNSSMMTVQAVVASIAHEVKQPLTGIISLSGAAQRFLGRSPPDIATAQAVMEDIKRAGFQADQVFESIRGLFRDVEHGSQLIDLNEVAVGALRTLERELEDHKIATRMQFASQLTPVTGHKGQLEEVVLNLIQNAIDAMAATADGSRELRVKTEQHGRDAVALSVEDSGPGIDPQKIDKLFDAFVTTKAKGMGLGLAISKMIIERHGGQISAASAASTGTRFQITLPIE